MLSCQSVIKGFAWFHIAASNSWNVNEMNARIFNAFAFWSKNHPCLNNIITVSIYKSSKYLHDSNVSVGTTEILIAIIIKAFEFNA